MPWRPSFRGERPTLGYLVIDWMLANLAAPDRGEYEPYEPTLEQVEFLLRFYEIDPRSGKRKIRRGVLSRPRGWGKSPFLAAIACAEALAPVVADGWDADGQPVGRTWESIRTPLVKIAAVSEAQTQNAWIPLLEMLQGPVLGNYPGLEPLGTFVNLPRGRIEPITASPTSVKGNKPVFAILDQTEVWFKSNGGLRLAETMRINAAKLGGTTIEAPNAYVPGLGSVAEASAQYHLALLEGKARDDGLLYDHREAPPDTDLEDKDSLLKGLAIAYGDSAAIKGGCRVHKPACKRRGWVDLDRIARDVWDPDIDPQTARADFLNQITHASDAWLSQPEWAGCADAAKVVAGSDLITLGFDGSRKRDRHGPADATALIGCRVSDGHLFEIGVWEQPDGPAGRDWQVPTPEVEAAVAMAFDRWNVIGFFADPAKWESYISVWEGRYTTRLKVKASRDHPIEWWMGAGRMRPTVRAVQRLHTAVVEREVTHDGSYALTRHVLNARRRPSSVGVSIGKDFPDSPRKIDAAVAAVLAFEARSAAVAAGVEPEPAGMFGGTF